MVPCEIQMLCSVIRKTKQHTFLGVDAQVTIALICKNYIIIDIRQRSCIEFSFLL